ncbi:DNA polymerase III subunit delta' [Aestuariivirga sp.]|jgi:DNA polymerase-3 subunit delta'|uniref:DNA polymerase III subunit delta' n=1 Tax=Aestuariivirga sp. TaxID=2650926 RepID=UPI0037849208
MAEEFQDPRDVPWHPRRIRGLVGHQQAEQRLLQAFQSEKLHHAWLISGPRGVGKATLAYRFARFLLNNPVYSPRNPFQTLQADMESPASRQIGVGAHPGLLVIERAVDQRAKRLKTVITVEDARAAQGFFSRTSASGGWRIAIVDCADDLNAESANALLKILEEPPERSLFLILCHQPGRLLPTIRSRCLQISLSLLSIDETVSVLRSLPPEAVDADPKFVVEAAVLSKGSPGKAIEFVGSSGASAFSEVMTRGKLTAAAAVEIATAFSGRESAEDYTIFCELLVEWIAEKARLLGLEGRGAALAFAHHDINASLRQADALNLDRRQTIIDALLRLDEALRAS